MIATASDTMVNRENGHKSKHKYNQLKMRLTEEMDKTKFVAFSTQKGGAGKTTLTVLMASYLHYVKGGKRRRRGL